MDVWTDRHTLNISVSTYIHGNSSDFGPTVSLCFVFVIRTTSLQHRLVDASSTSNNTCQHISCSSVIAVLSNSWLVGWGLTALSIQGSYIMPTVVYSFDIWRNTKSTTKNQIPGPIHGSISRNSCSSSSMQVLL